MPLGGRLGVGRQVVIVDCNHGVAQRDELRAQVTAQLPVAAEHRDLQGVCE